MSPNDPATDTSAEFKQKFPATARVNEVKAHCDQIEAFMTWLKTSRHLELYRLINPHKPIRPAETLEQLVAAFFEIDMAKYAEEAEAVESWYAEQDAKYEAMVAEGQRAMAEMTASTPPTVASTAGTETPGLVVKNEHKNEQTNGAGVVP